jgi:hypothetical protein
MRTLSPATTAGVAGPVTAPGYFVEILFAGPLRVSSRGTLVWSGNTWTAWDVRVSGLAFDGAASAQNGTLILGNTDLSIGALILNEGIADRTINVWSFLGDAPATADPVQIFAGVGDTVAIDPDRGTVTITLQQSAAGVLYCPRRYITRENGFSVLPPVGTLIPFNGETFQIEANVN